MERVVEGQAATKLSKMDLYRIWSEKSGEDNLKKREHLQTVIFTQMRVEEQPDNVKKDIRQDITRFCSELAKRWQNCYRSEKKFLAKYAAWLQEKFKFSHQLEVDNIFPSTSRLSGGRPKISFSESSERSKRRKTATLRDQWQSSELSYASQMSLRASGEVAAAKLINEAVHTTPTRAEKILGAWEKSKAAVLKPFTPEEALSLIILAKLTKNQYIKIRNQAKERNADIYPSYRKVKAAKKKCYPPKECINLSDQHVEVNLQSIMDHTASRILEIQKDVLNSLPTNCQHFTLISKWGCDGSTGHSQYKQSLREGFSDSDIFISSFVPLQMYCTDTGSSSERKIIFWQNPRPSSVRYCRPIKMQFVKETTAIAHQEIQRIEKQIAELVTSEININGKSISVCHQMILTMIDGKICNAATSTSSSQVCYVCGAKPKDMNKLDTVVRKSPDVTTYRFGLSTLHAWIRFLECFIHISYRLDIKKWQIREDDKEAVHQRKIVIQKRFREELNLYIDQVKPGGSGTTNDGNTARRFFEDYEKSAQITGINQDLLRRSAVILQTLSSGYKIDCEAFEKYCLDTAKIFVQEYPWYYMPVSVHKILIHGPSIISAAILPIGLLSEEAQECRNKDLKYFRRSHSRKCSREATNEDVFNLLLISSDPLITGITSPPKRKRKHFLPEVFSLIKPSEEPEVISSNESIQSECEAMTDTDSDF